MDGFRLDMGILIRSWYVLCVCLPIPLLAGYLVREVVFIFMDTPIYPTWNGIKIIFMPSLYNLRRFRKKPESCAHTHLKETDISQNLNREKSKKTP